MGSPLHPIPYDVVLHGIVPYLNVQDLSRLMRANRTYCAYMLRDEVWQHIRQRCIAVAPFLEYLVFDSFPWRSEDYNDAEGVRKKARLRKSDKRPYKFPRGGNWYVLKTYIAKARDAASLRKLVHFPAYHVYEKPPMFRDTLSYTVTPFTIFQHGQPLSAEAGKTYCARPAVVAFACLLQTPVDQGIIRWHMGTIEYCRIDNAYQGEEVICWIHRRFAQWCRNGVVSTEKTPGFAKLFWGH